MDVALLYISRCALSAPDPAGQVGDILTVSRARNADLDLTGALIWTGASFAQILEGSGEAVETVMTSICRDSRHAAVRILFTRPITQRRFHGWRLAYSGSAPGPVGFVDRHLAQLFSGFSAQTRATEELVTLMEEYARMAERKH